MQSKLLNDKPERTFALILDTGDEVMSCLERFAAETKLTASRLTAIGAFRDVTLGYFDWSRKEYRPHRFAEQLEVLALIGDVAMEGDRPKIHAHVVLGRSDCTTLGGHLLRATVRPTLEIIVTDAPAYLCREHDPESGLTLIRGARGTGTSGPSSADVVSNARPPAAPNRP